jgi:two-component system phosphate regulon sensor histidine kinase PhoR
MFGLRRRMSVTAMVAAAAALLAVLLLVGPRLRARAIGHAREGLLDQAQLVARLVREPLRQGAGLAELDPLVDAAASKVRARVTIIALDGRVLADTALSGQPLVDLENHGTRPEVLEALANGTGSSLRHSTTVKRELLYVATQVRDGDELLGIARVAFTVELVSAQAHELEQAVAVALLLAFGITAVLTALLSNPLVGPLHEIMSAARQFAAGNLEARIEVHRNDELGELASILNTTANELQERLAEQARERARTEAILSAMEDGILAVGHEGRLLVANGAVCQMLGLEAPIGRHHSEVILDEPIQDVLTSALEDGERLAEEVWIPRLSRVFAVTAVPLLESAQARPGAVLTFRDVTRRVDLERMRRDFVANASHELRTPLTSVRGFVEALEDGAAEDPTRSRRFLGKIRVHADRMAALVEDLLELHRVESGDRAPRFETITPAEIVEDLATSFSSQAARQRITLEHDDRGAPAVPADPDRLRRALEALVDNAIKYTPAGGRVEIRSGPAPFGGARFEVIDNGPGIAPEHIPRVFERFYRVDKARSRELGGTGLGLSIVKHLVESIGAKVDLRSVVDEGSCFRITVPAGGQTAVSERSEPAARD